MVGVGTHYPLEEPVEFQLELASLSTREHTGPKKKCPFAAFKEKLMSLAKMLTNSDSSAKMTN